MKEVSLKCIEGTASKFWTIKQTDSQLQVKYGRIGTAGQEKTTDCASSAEALASLEKQVKEKLKKGYELVSETTCDEDQNKVDKRATQSAALTEKSARGGVISSTATATASAATASATSATTATASATTATATVTTTTSATATLNNSLRDKPSLSESKLHDDASSLSTCEPLAVINRELKLSPVEVTYAFFRREAPLPLPEVVPFDFDEAMTRLLSCPDADDKIIELWDARIKGKYRWSKEECQFWLIGLVEKHKANQNFGNDGQPCPSGGYKVYEAECISKAFAKYPIGGEFGKSQIIELIESVGYDTVYAYAYPGSSTKISVKEPQYSLIYPMIGLLSMSDIIEVWQRVWTTFNNPHVRPDVAGYVQSFLIGAIRNEVVPYITDEPLAQLRGFLAGEMQRLKWSPKSSDDQIPLPYLMAGLFGMHDELLPVINAIPNGFYKKEEAYPDLARPQLLLLGLNDPDLMSKHWQRLGLRIDSHGECISYTSHTQWRALGPVFDLVNAIGAQMYYTPQQAYVEKVLSMLLNVVAPETAPHVLQLAANKRFAKVCHKWLSDNPIITLIGLMDAYAKDTKMPSEAKRYLKDLTRRVGKHSLPSEYHASYDALVAEVQGANVVLSGSKCPDWLTDLFASDGSTKKSSLPEYLRDVSLLPVAVEGYCLDDKQINQILMCIKASAPDKVHPLLIALRTKADRRQFDDFVWDIFERWLAEQGPSKDKWCMLSIGYLASDETVCKLIPLMKDWRAHGNPGRAGFGLDCMRACGSDMALMKIHEISQSASLKSLRSKAQELMILIAQEKGYTTEQFEDRIVPNCGLDSTGNRIFDFGPRQFRFVLGQDLKAFVKDPDGKVKTDLPSPNQSDDPVLAAQAVKDWKSIKSQVKTVAKSQATRLELAMISGRRWTADEFETLLLKHPLLKIICKTLIWGQFDDDDKLLSTFRFTDEGELADEQEKTYELAKSQRVGIVHPLHLSAQQLSKWGEIVSDYGMVPPFGQLGRPSFALTEEENQLDRIDRFAGLLVEAVIIPGTLERCNWVRESVGDGGIFCGHYKYFPGKDLTAFVSYPGIIVGVLTESDKQQFEDIGFYKGRVKVDSWYSRADAARAKLADIDPIVMSEVLGDLTLVMNKAVKA